MATNENLATFELVDRDYEGMGGLLHVRRTVDVDRRGVLTLVQVETWDNRPERFDIVHLTRSELQYLVDAARAQGWEVK